MHKPQYSTWRGYSIASEAASSSPVAMLNQLLTSMRTRNLYLFQYFTLNKRKYCDYVILGLGGVGTFSLSVPRMSV